MLFLAPLVIGSTLTYGPSIGLGHMNGLDLAVRPVYDPVGPGGINYLSLAFTAIKSGQRLAKIEFPVGLSTKKPPYQFQTKRFMGRAVKQVFVSVYHQQIISFLLDFNGEKVTRIYADNRDRVWTKPMWDSRGRFYVEELVKVDWLLENGKRPPYNQVKNRIYFTKKWEPIEGKYGGPSFEPSR